MPAPKVDERTAHEIAADVGTLLPIYVEGWPEDRENGELADALIHVFARFGELIVERLNKTPEKNFLAFLDLLGVSPLPLQAAHAPLTFYLASGPVSHALVPAGTQVAAPPPKGQQEPVVFETERDLVIVSAKLESLILKDGGRGRFTDLSSILTPPAPQPGGTAAASDASSEQSATSSAAGATVIPHVLCVPIPVYPVWPSINQVRLKFTLDAALAAPVDARTLQWEVCCAPPPKAGTSAAGQKDDMANAFAMAPTQDTTENLAKSGDVVFSNLPELPLAALGGYPAHWLLCRLLTPVTYAATASAGMVRETQLPSVKTLAIEMRMEQTGLPIEQALFNSLKLDLTKDFYPFGVKPKFGDTLYLASCAAFSNPDAVVTFRVTVTNPASSGVDTPIFPAKPQDTKLSWEFWDGKIWAELDGAESSGRIHFRGQYTDNTQSFSENGDVSFKFPSPPAPFNLNGQTNYWVRVRITAGDYGKEAHYEPVKGNLIERELSRSSFTATPATFAPPSIHSISVDYRVTKETQPEAVLAYNDFVFDEISPQSGPFKPFLPAPPDQVLPALYFGFTLPPSALPKPSVFPNVSMSVYAGLSEGSTGSAVDPTVSVPTASWEYWNGAGWSKSIVLDDTQGMRRSGIFRLLAPADFAASSQFSLGRYWLRMRQIDPLFQPALNHMLLNTTMAIQGSTIANEILGSSNETPNQVFRTTQKPVLAGEKLEIRESTEPSHKERGQIRAAAGEDAIVQMKKPTGKGDTFWVHWSGVPNFYGSGPRDRHYLLDRMTGKVTFGDGVNGMIPPALPGNVRLTYRKGGGTAGNQPAGVIAQLKSAVPYVQKASNCEAAVGGSDPESDAAVLTRGPLGIRHGGRAVTREDFEDLAMFASREVARAKCVPLFDLTCDPDAKKSKAGMVSLILVPRSIGARPRPSLDLFERVRSYLDARRQLTAQLKLLGPEYVRVDVECEITATSPEAAGQAETAARAAINRFLHPVNGGIDGTGWDFGREPKRSDFYGLLEGIPGVSHVRELRVTLVPERPGAETTGRFLICCGNHNISMTLKE